MSKSTQKKNESETNAYIELMYGGKEGKTLMPDPPKKEMDSNTLFLGMMIGFGFCIALMWYTGVGNNYCASDAHPTPALDAYYNEMEETARDASLSPF